MLSNFLKNISILKKFLFINLLVFIIFGSLTAFYLKGIQPNLINKKTSNHIQIIDNTINHITRLKIKFNEEDREVSAFISFSNNGQQFSVAMPITFLRQPMPKHVVPKAIQPGFFSLVNVSGSGFVDTLDIHCFIVELDTNYKAFYVSDNLVQCGIFIPLSFNSLLYLFHSPAAFMMWGTYF